jgi:hypothetical protein
VARKSRFGLVRLLAALITGRVVVRNRLTKRFVARYRTFARLVIAGKAIGYVSQRSKSRSIQVRTDHAIIEVDPT